MSRRGLDGAAPSPFPPVWQVGRVAGSRVGEDHRTRASSPPLGTGLLRAFGRWLPTASTDRTSSSPTPVHRDPSAAPGRRPVPGTACREPPPASNPPASARRRCSHPTGRSAHVGSHLTRSPQPHRAGRSLTHGEWSSRCVTIAGCGQRSRSAVLSASGVGAPVRRCRTEGLICDGEHSWRARRAPAAQPCMIAVSCRYALMVRWSGGEVLDDGGAGGLPAQRGAGLGGRDILIAGEQVG